MASDFDSSSMRSALSRLVYLIVLSELVRLENRLGHPAHAGAAVIAEAVAAANAVLTDADVAAGLLAWGIAFDARYAPGTSTPPVADDLSHALSACAGVVAGLECVFLEARLGHAGHAAAGTAAGDAAAADAAIGPDTALQDALAAMMTYLAGRYDANGGE